MSGVLRDQVIWIVGASSGIGAAVAEVLAPSGARLMLSARRGEALQALQQRLGQAVDTQVLDITDTAAVQATVDAIVARHGRLDAVVNCAGMNVVQRASISVGPAAFAQIVELNLCAAAAVAMAALPQWRRQRGGLVVNIGSWVSRYPAAVTGAAYAAAKRGLAAFGEALNAEENRHGIRACTLMPAGVNTEILDRRPHPPSAQQRARLLQPQDVARIVAFVLALPAGMCLNEIVVSPTQASPLTEPSP